MSAQKSYGFTLVEILIVVVIMAVLAAVVIPQFTGSADDARSSTAEFNLGGVRSAIQTYRAHHSGTNPALDATNGTIPGLITGTDAAGNAGTDFGPYLMEIPENTLTGNSAIKAVTTAGTAPVEGDVTAGNAGGWIYDASTGRIWLDSDVDNEWGW
jgi:prepilin-type N-terminal cleavage/methylation domain-containing protein